MKKLNSMRHYGVWISALFLFVCVAVTTMVWADRLNIFYMNASGAVEIAFDTGDAEKNSVNETHASTAEVVEESRTMVTAGNNTTTRTTSFKPGFEAGDAQVVWSTNTQVDIFKVSYVNGEQIVTVQSDNGERVIAPGTENSYTFKLANTGNVPVQYSLYVDAYFTPEDIVIPVTARMQRYDNVWFAGDTETYVDIPTLDGVEDYATLGVNKYTYYTLDWCWPYESGDDEYDTLLGNMAVDEDLTFTIVIRTVAEATNKGGGLDIPQTGDSTNLILFIALAAGSLVLIIVICIYIIIEKMRSRSEAEEIEKQ